MLHSSLGAPVNATAEHLSEIRIREGNIVMSTLETEDARIAVRTRPTQDFMLFG